MRRITRDKAITSLKHDKVDGVEVVADGKSMVFSKKASVWTFVKPLAARAALADRRR